MFLEYVDTGEVFVDKSVFQFGYDPYNTVDTRAVYYSVLASPSVGRMLNGEAVEKRLRAFRV